jgi:hypothetical protein
VGTTLIKPRCSPSSGASRHLLPANSGAKKEGVPANIEPFVKVLGVDLAMVFLMEFGGAELYIAKRPQERGRLAQLVGHEKAAELALAAEFLPRRIPLAKAWMARTLLTQGHSVADIARRLRVSDVTVRKFTSDEREARQLSFLD